MRTAGRQANNPRRKFPRNRSGHPADDYYIDGLRWESFQQFRLENVCSHCLSHCHSQEQRPHKFSDCSESECLHRMHGPGANYRSNDVPAVVKSIDERETEGDADGNVQEQFVQNPPDEESILGGNPSRNCTREPPDRTLVVTHRIWFSGIDVVGSNSTEIDFVRACRVMLFGSGLLRRDVFCIGKLLYTVARLLTDPLDSENVFHQAGELRQVHVSRSYGQRILDLRPFTASATISSVMVRGRFIGREAARSYGRSPALTRERRAMKRENTITPLRQMFNGENRACQGMPPKTASVESHEYRFRGSCRKYAFCVRAAPDIRGMRMEMLQRARTREQAGRLPVRPVSGPGLSSSMPCGAHETISEGVAIWN